MNRSYDGGENENQTIGSVKSNKPQNNKINNIKKLKYKVKVKIIIKAIQKMKI